MTDNQQSQPPHYVIDASCIIAGFNDMYAETVFPTLWDRVGGLITNGVILVIPEVIAEVSTTRDSLPEGDIPSRWIKQFNDEHNRFSAYQQSVDREYDAIRSRQSSTKTSKTDLKLIAWAKITNATVITQEKLGGGGHKIPKICSDEGVAFTNMIGMMKSQGWTFQ